MRPAVGQLSSYGIELGGDFLWFNPLSVCDELPDRATAVILTAPNAIVTGDSLSDLGDGLDVQLGGRKHVTRDDVVRRLHLPIELVLPAHGEPTDRAALQRVLS